MKKRTVGVVGGGPAGIMAAITAARQGAWVTLFERNERIGKKLLATGNGKCNLGNRKLTEKEYYGSSREWIMGALERFQTEDTIVFFRGLGLLVKEKNGYLYPACEQAAVVLDVLRIELHALGVSVKTGCKVNRIEENREKGGRLCLDVIMETGEERFCFDRVILACGSKAAPKTGSDGSGYRLAAQMKHSIVPTVPALVQLRCREDYLKSVAGVRTEALIRICQNGKEVASERGELQLTEYGISGIPVFQVSRTVNYLLRNQREAVATIDLLPDYSTEAFENMQAARSLLQKERTVEEYFTGMLHKKLMLLFIKMAGLKPGQPIEQASGADIKRVYSLCREWKLHIVGSNSYDNAQVCAGGVDTAEVTTDMESKKLSGVYFAGEILDVDGKCGGYNLQWAWCSGYLAGMAASQNTTNGMTGEI